MVVTVEGTTEAFLQVYRLILPLTTADTGNLRLSTMWEKKQSIFRF